MFSLFPPDYRQRVLAGSSSEATLTLVGGVLIVAAGALLVAFPATPGGSGWARLVAAAVTLWGPSIT